MEAITAVFIEKEELDYQDMSTLLALLLLLANQDSTSNVGSQLHNV